MATTKGIGGHHRSADASDDWITPRVIIETLGPFDLDPCACLQQPWACAKAWYTIKDDGLQQFWEGRVWLNPPYGRRTGEWMAKLADHGRGTALVFARTETEWFVEQVWERADAVMFLHGRLNFARPCGSPTKKNAGGPSVLIAYGKEDVDRLVASGFNGTMVRKWRGR
jgi:phage N-6-adenine-methyltransferase